RSRRRRRSRRPAGRHLRGLPVLGALATARPPPDEPAAMTNHYNLDDETRMILDTVRGFVQDELQPHEDLVDRQGYVPEDIGREIERKSKALGLFAANQPAEVGGGGLSMKAMSLVE